jgi:hypothetical protein
MSSIESELDVIEKNEQEILMSVQDDLLGVRPSILGRKLRPMKLSAVALLQKTGNELVSGKPVEECSNLIIDSCKLVVMQSVPLREAIRLSENLDELEEKAYELADTIEPSQLPEFQDLVLGLIRNSQNTRVEPIPQAGAREELTVDAVGE